MFSGGLSPWHLMLVLLVAVVVFGSKKLPDVARGLGQSMRILKAETKAMKEDGQTTSSAPASPPPAVEPGPSASPAAENAAGQSEKTAARTEQPGAKESEQRTA